MDGAAAAKLTEDHESLQAPGVVGGSRRDWPSLTVDQPRLVTSLGSTGGVHNRTRSKRLPDHARGGPKEGDTLLVGHGLFRSPRRQLAACNDAAGVTAEFPMNALRVASRAPAGGCDPEVGRPRRVMSTPGSHALGRVSYLFTWQPKGHYF